MPRRARFPAVPNGCEPAACWRCGASLPSIRPSRWAPGHLQPHGEVTPVRCRPQGLHHPRLNPDAHHDRRLDAVPSHQAVERRRKEGVGAIVPNLPIAEEGLDRVGDLPTGGPLEGPSDRGLQRQTQSRTGPWRAPRPAQLAAKSTLSQCSGVIRHKTIPGRGFPSMK